MTNVLTPSATAQKRFRNQVMTAEMLDAKTEFDLACAWRDRRDEDALHRLITAYTRLAISMAKKYIRCGVPLNDLVQEASVGLLKAADKFDPDRGVRFSTYAVWWIKASLQECVIWNQSLVKMGTTSAQKKLFFHLRRVKARLMREAWVRGEAINSQQLNQMIATELDVPLADVISMSGRLSGSDFSLNALRSSDNENGEEWVDTLPDDASNTTADAENQVDREVLVRLLADAFGVLSEREQVIVRGRKMDDPRRTLECLSQEFDISRERVRQISVEAFEKMRKYLVSRGYGSIGDFFDA